MSKGWIGVDLDGTLAHYDVWRGEEHIGRPVPAMLERVKTWLEQGQEVRIFTARVSHQTFCSDGELLRALRAKIAIEQWCKKHLGRVLEVTHKKDYQMLELWDDRAVQVIANTGARADGKE